jgi:hypothetical protein
MQERGGSGGSTRIGGVNYCDASSVPDLLEKVRAHELQHITVFQEEFQRLTPAEIAKLEVLTSTAASNLLQRYDGAAGDLRERAKQTSRAVVDRKNGQYVLRPKDARGDCVLRNSIGGDLENEPEAGES